MRKTLALNYSATAALQRKHQLLIGALPTLCMIVPFVPMMKVAMALGSRRFSGVAASGGLVQGGSFFAK